MSAYASLLRGMVIGTLVGILYARKPGTELREDVRDWFEGANDKGRSWTQRFLNLIPLRVKVAAGIGAARGAGSEMYRESKRKIRS